MKNLTNNTEDSKMNNLNDNTANNTTTNNTEDNTMNLFADIAVPVQERTNTMEWTLDDCKNNLKVIFRECSEADSFIVSINLGGLTSLKVFNGKTTFKMKKGLLEKEEVLARVIGADDVIEEARTRMIQSLRRAKQSREATKERELENINKQQMNKLSKLQQKAINNLKKEDLQERIDLASLISEVKEIESNQALTQLLSI
jgi:hypothetical protein